MPFGPLNLPDPPPLPSPGLLDRHLFESPWLLVSLLTFGAIVTIFTAYQRGRLRRAFPLALASVVGALAVWIASRVVTTDREKMLAATESLVRAVASGNGSSVDALLADDTSLHLGAFGGEYAKSVIVGRVNREFVRGGEYEVQPDWKLLERQAAKDGPSVGRVQIKVRVTPEKWKFPVLSWWRVDFRAEGDSWKARRLELLGLSR